MTVTDPNIRVSDADRERAIGTLRSSVAEGRLSLDEFADRTEIVLRAQVGSDLLEATEDLPAIVPRSSRAHRRATRLTAAVFAHVVRSGRVVLRKRSAAVSVFADLDLDLRNSEVEADASTITVLTLFGNVDVYLPAGARSDVRGLTLFGHRRTWGTPTGSASAVGLDIRSLSMFGTVDVWHVPAAMKGDYSAITRQLQQSQVELAPAEDTSGSS